MTAPNDTPDPAGQPAQPIQLPDDHPLVKAYTAQKDEIKNLKSAVTERDTQLSAAQNDLTAARNQGLPEWQQRFDDLESRFNAEKSAREQAEQQAAEATRAQLRTDRAAEKNFPLALAKKLTGSTAEEIDAEIDELLPFLSQGKPHPNPQQGTGGGGQQRSVEAGAAMFAARKKPQ